ncbi:MAG: hypothetical protein AAF602_11610 [Myxococcota bacterium]
MSRLDDWLTLLDDPTSQLVGVHPSDEVLATWMVQLAFSDGVVQEDELAFFARLAPEGTPVARWVEQRAVKPVDLDAIAPLLTSDAERRKLLALGVRVVGLDSAVATEEIVHLHRIVDHLGLPHEAIRIALADVVAPGGPVSADRVTAVVADFAWTRMRTLPGPGLVTLARPGRSAEVIVEPDGLWARFDHGEASVLFADIVAYTRLPVRGHAFHIRTDEADHTYADPAFQELGILLDRLYGR